MFIYGSDFFVFKPGLVLIAAGLVITLPLSLGPVTIGGVTFSLYSMLFGMTATLLGLQSFFFGCLAQVLHDYTGNARKRWLSVFRYTRTVLISAALFLVGLVLSGQLVVRYLGPFPRLSPGSSPPTYLLGCHWAAAHDHGFHDVQLHPPPPRRRPSEQPGSWA
jgi:hypothetical protein